MASSDDWQERLFCIFFIGKRGPDKKLIPRRKFNRGVGKLRKGLKTALGAYTTVRSLEARGDTRQWGPEPTRLIIVIAATEQEELLDSTVAKLGKDAANDLEQDSIWITKQRLTLFVARRVGRQGL